ncbi:MAG: DUF3306 domain-containing protein [Pseudomonadota bacterium]
MSKEAEGRLARWSRRKQKARDGIAEPEAVASTPDPLATPEPGLSEPDYLDAHGLVDPDLMDAGDDFSVFMKDAVPQTLKRRALRRLWRLNPALANLDQLVEYGEDYTDAAMVPEVIKTAYRVGRGFLTDEDEADAASPADADAGAAEEAATEADVIADENDGASPSDSLCDPAITPDAAGAVTPPAGSDASASASAAPLDHAACDEEAPSRRPNRMRFTIS